FVHREPRHCSRASSAAASVDLGAVHEHTECEGVADPGVFPVVPELVEALAELGDLDRASSVTETLTWQAQDQAHPWGLVTAQRCHALVRLAAGRYDRAAGAALAARRQNSQASPWGSTRPVAS